MVAITTNNAIGERVHRFLRQIRPPIEEQVRSLRQLAHLVKGHAVVPRRQREYRAGPEEVEVRVEERIYQRVLAIPADKARFRVERLPAQIRAELVVRQVFVEE